jgi:sugar lactone lactonase YvrE
LTCALALPTIARLPENAADSRFARVVPIAPRGAAGYELEIVRPPAALWGANGIRVAPDGRLWICEAFARRISACDTRTGELTTVIADDGTLVGPDDLAFDADGSAYITDGDRITARRADGTTFTLVSGLSHPNGITVDGDGRLFVDEFRPDGRLLEIDRVSGSVRVVAEGLDLPNACELGPDGRLYLQNVLAGTIFAVDVDTGAVEQVVDGLKRVSSVKFDRRGRLVASQADRGVVTAIDLGSGRWETIARMPHRTIDNIAFDADGTLFVSSYSTGCVLRVPEDGDPDGEILVPPGLAAPASLSPLDERTLLVGNFFTIVSVDVNDGTFAEWSPWSPLSGEEILRAAWAIDRDSAYALTGGGQVYRCRFGMSMADVKTAAAAGDAPAAVREVVTGGATAITGADGGLLIAFGGGEIRCFESNGRTRAVTSTGQSRIAALAATDGMIAPAAPDAGTVHVIGDGRVMTAEGFALPTGVAVADGAVFVAEHGDRQVVRWDLDSGERTVVARDLAFGSPGGTPLAWGAAGMLTWHDGSVLIGCDGDGSIRRLIRR